jgi:hypothetical protein
MASLNSPPYSSAEDLPQDRLIRKIAGWLVIPIFTFTGIYFVGSALIDPVKNSLLELYGIRTEATFENSTPYSGYGRSSATGGMGGVHGQIVDMKYKTTTGEEHRASIAVQGSSIPSNVLRVRYLTSHPNIFVSEYELNTDTGFGAKFFLGIFFLLPIGFFFLKRKKSV